MNPGNTMRWPVSQTASSGNACVTSRKGPNAAMCAPTMRNAAWGWICGEEPPPRMVAGPTIMQSSLPHGGDGAKERSRPPLAQPRHGAGLSYLEMGSKLPAMASRTDILLPDALVREVEWIDPGRLAAALEAGGKLRVSLLESGLPESPWGIWTFLAWDPEIALEHDGQAWTS